MYLKSRNKKNKERKGVEKVLNTSHHIILKYQSIKISHSQKEKKKEEKLNRRNYSCILPPNKRKRAK